MGRVLMRVPLDFDAPINEVWRGYLIPEELMPFLPVTGCVDCESKGNICEEDADYCVCYNPKWRRLWFYEPPEGEGYQLWENTTEGSPQSPVFETAEELAEWCEVNATVWGTEHYITKEEWLVFFNHGPVCIRDKIGDVEVVFI